MFFTMTFLDSAAAIVPLQKCGISIYRKIVSVVWHGTFWGCSFTKDSHQNWVWRKSNIAFWPQTFFHLLLDAASRARNHHLLSTNPIFSTQDLGIEQKRLKLYGTAISRRFQPCKNIPPTPMAIVPKLNVKHPLANSWCGDMPSNWVGGDAGALGGCHSIARLINCSN